ncbi:MAG: hypothetical protein RBQ64_03745 [Candidatus Izemoplasmatales bacterium]|jgi:hypothetical protein|nr:hypothetical protein [Candidatus Izemoplasmatales bacterium]
MVKFCDLEEGLKDCILPKLRVYYDLVTFEERSNWIMKIFYGHKEIFESFETYELEPQKEESEFEKKKLRLFLDGVYLYKVKDDGLVELVCNCYDEEYYYYR